MFVFFQVSLLCKRSNFLNLNFTNMLCKVSGVEVDRKRRNLYIFCDCTDVLLATGKS